MKNVRVARRYAMALMMAADQAKSIDRTAKDLESIAGVLSSSRELRLMLTSPVVTAQKKSSVFKEIFGSRLHPTTLEFIDLLIEKHREGHVPDVIAQFNVLRDERMGIVTVGVTSAVEFTAPQEKSLQSSLERYTGKKVRVHLSVDGAIRGGLLVQIGDTVLDASVTHHLEVLKTKFVQGMDVPH